MIVWFGTIGLFLCLWADSGYGMDSIRWFSMHSGTVSAPKSTWLNHQNKISQQKIDSKRRYPANTTGLDLMSLVSQNRVKILHKDPRMPGKWSGGSWDVQKMSSQPRMDGDWFLRKISRQHQWTWSDGFREPDLSLTIPYGPQDTRKLIWELLGCPKTRFGQMRTIRAFF